MWDLSFPTRDRTCVLRNNAELYAEIEAKVREKMDAAGTK